jgi:hypothetical protein
MAMQKSERPPGNPAAGVAENLGKPQQPETTATTPAPQALRRHPPEILAHVEASAHSAIQVTRSRDGSRLTVAPLTRLGDGPWLPAGAAPSLPTVLVDATIDALTLALAKIRAGDA